MSTQTWRRLFPGEEFPPVEDKEVPAAGGAPLRNAREEEATGGRRRQQWGLPSVRKPSRLSETLAAKAIDGVRYLRELRVEPGRKTAGDYAGKPLACLNEMVGRCLEEIEEALADYGEMARDEGPDGRLGALEIQSGGARHPNEGRKPKVKTRGVGLVSLVRQPTIVWMNGVLSAVLVWFNSSTWEWLRGNTWWSVPRTRPMLLVARGVLGCRRAEVSRQRWARAVVHSLIRQAEVLRHPATVGAGVLSGDGVGSMRV
ncbi:hypothetical protein EAI_13894 [Harpegnathos saltator]|uniref:Uncharacterized protein n=1 Tax=Harpegnathos saltator TaxID=610380 RepID=E2BJU1_HARSA|nr:hypothetical protein EAI_13894 [Harpegnathos saltator]